MGQKKYLPASDISSLPDVVKRQILEPTVKDKDFGMSEREKIAKRLVSAFQIKFEKLDGIELDNLKPSEIVIAEFGAYLKTFPYALTGSEILEAYRMASRGELRDFLGNQIQFFPTLSTAQAGRILMAYQEFKIHNQQHTLGMAKLNRLINPETPPTKEEAKDLKKRNWNLLIEAIKQNKPCDHAFLFYEDVVKKGALKGFIGNQEAQKIVIKQKMQAVFLEEKQKVKSALFNKFEIAHLAAYFADQNEMLKADIKHSFDRLQAMATTLVKNDLVYNWVKKNVNKNET